MSQSEELPRDYDWREKMTRAAQTMTGARRVIDAWFSRSYVPEVVTSLLCLGLLGLAISMIVDGDTYEGVPSFQAAMGPDGLAVPEAWGALLAAPCIATLLSLLARRRDVYWPLAAIVVWMTAFSYFAGQSSTDADTVNSAVIIYSTISLVLTMLAIMYAKEGEGP